ncbi:hypothetical protein K2P47_00020 [Patescibacteria group bacterium]|nr:hypothetical protein [Patescibacteria group bacterium]
MGLVLLTTILLTGYLIRPDKLPGGTILNVPNNTVIPLTFIGALYRLYLSEGDFPWWGQRLFLALSTITLRDFTTRKKDGDTTDAFFKVTPIPYTLFNSAPREVDGVEVIDKLIMGVSKGGSPVGSELQITLQSKDPNPALRNDDPGLEIAERARSMMRTCQGYFTSVDNALAKDGIAGMIEGETMVVSFIMTTAENLAEGSIVRDTGGEPTYFMVEVTEADALAAKKKNPQASAKDILAVATKRTIKEYKKHLDTHLTPAMKAAVSIIKKKKQRDGTEAEVVEYVIETRSVQIGLGEILERNGFDLISATVGNVVYDEDLKTAAVSAELQTFENTVQVKSAKATAEALKELESSADQMNDPAYFDKLGIAASADQGGRAQFHRISTDNKYATVGVAAGLVNQQPAQTPVPATVKEK